MSWSRPSLTQVERKMQCVTSSLLQRRVIGPDARVFPSNPKEWRKLMVSSISPAQSVEFSADKVYYNCYKTTNNNEKKNKI